MAPKRKSSRQCSTNPLPQTTLETNPLPKTTSAPSKATTQSKSLGQLKKDDHLILVSWLKNQKNYDACFGGEKETKVVQPPSSKVNGFQMMASELKKKKKGRLDLTSKKMREQFKNY